MSERRVSAETITHLAEVQGIPLADSSMAERLAAAATAAIAVVEDAQRNEAAARALAEGFDPLCEGNPWFDCEPGDFLGTLERLAVADE